MQRDAGIERVSDWASNRGFGTPPEMNTVQEISRYTTRPGFRYHSLHTTTPGSDGRKYDVTGVAKNPA